MKVIGTRGEGSVSEQIKREYDVRLARLGHDGYLKPHRNGFGCGACWVETGRRDVPAPCLHYPRRAPRSRVLLTAMQYTLWNAYYSLPSDQQRLT